MFKQQCAHCSPLNILVSDLRYPHPRTSRRTPSVGRGMPAFPHAFLLPDGSAHTSSCPSSSPTSALRTASCLVGNQVYTTDRLNWFDPSQISIGVAVALTCHSLTTIFGCLFPPFTQSMMPCMRRTVHTWGARTTTASSRRLRLSTRSSGTPRKRKAVSPHSSWKFSSLG